jgi:hypothetical protein
MRIRIGDRPGSEKAQPPSLSRFQRRRLSSGFRLLIP